MHLITSTHIQVPPSQTTVSVKVIDTTLTMICDSTAFIQPPINGPDHGMKMNTICFLIENKKQQKRVLFDCGSRKDPATGSPYTRKMLSDHVKWFEIRKGVDEILKDGNFDLEDLDAVIWSHWHWDHIGDSTRFPKATNIIVGPGFMDTFTPGWPKDPEAVILESDVEDRTLHEISFGQEIGGFKAYDLFGDGSFYLLDVPGHAVGHMCGLARTSPTTFVFMGGDCCHFAGTFRPSDAPISASLCGPPALSFAKGPEVLNKESLYQISATPKSAYCEPKVAQESVEKLKGFDADPDIFICLAHDNILLDILPLFNSCPEKDIND
ncbi:beta-lactamase-like protein [Aspergillus heterothallicus]